MRFRASKLFVSVIPVLGLGVGIGFLASIMGVGGGFIMVPALIYLLKVPTNVVVGTSLFQIIFVAAFTTIVHSTTNQTVDVVLAFLLMVGGVVGAQYGAKAGQKLRGEQLRALLALLVLAVALRLGVRPLRQAPASLFSLAGADSDARAIPDRRDRCFGAVARCRHPPGRRIPTSCSIPKAIQIGLSTDKIAITADFAGADLTIFGSLENADPLVIRQGRYDVIVVLEGPARPVVVRRKGRFLGMWINMASETFVNVPVSYSVATTRVLQDITDPNNYRQLSLGADNLHIEPLDKDGNPATIKEFERPCATARRRSVSSTCVSAASNSFRQSLFRASLPLAPNIPVGTHKARAFLFRNGVFIKESSAQLAIVKSGFEQSIARNAADHGFLYGIFAVALAMLTGWLGRIIFRKD